MVVWEATDPMWTEEGWQVPLASPPRLTGGLDRDVRTEERFFGSARKLSCRSFRLGH